VNNSSQSAVQRWSVHSPVGDSSTLRACSWPTTVGEFILSVALSALVQVEHNANHVKHRGTTAERRFLPLAISSVKNNRSALAHH
jgi:hypothetical protein